MTPGRRPRPDDQAAAPGMPGLRPVPDRSGDGARTAQQLHALRHRAAHHPRRSAEPPSRPHLRRHGAVHRRVDGHADEGLDRGHRARDRAGVRPRELVARGLWPLAIAVAFTTAYAPLGKFLATLYVLIGLEMPRPPPRMRDIFLLSRRLNTWCMLDVLLLGVFVAYTKLGDLVTIELVPPSMRWACSPSSGYGAGGVRSAGRLGGDRTARPDGRTHACRPAARLATGRHGLRRLRPGLRARRDRRTLPALRLDGARAQAQQRVAHLGPGARRHRSLHPGQRLSGADRDAARRRPAQHHPGRRRGTADPRMYPLAALVFFASIMVPLFKLLGLGSMLRRRSSGVPGRAPPS